MDLVESLAPTLKGLGFELVDCQWIGRGKLRVLIDKSAGITVDDCAFVSHQISRLFEVEGFDYQRLEVSSPGLNRPLKKTADFERFRGERAHLKLRLPLNGRRNFSGVIGEIHADVLQIEVEGRSLAIDMANIDKARLIPKINRSERI